MAAVPDEVKDKVKAYGKGIVSPWTPQQLILDHPVWSSFSSLLISSSNVTVRL